VELLISLIVPLAFAGLSFGSDDDEGSSSDDLENDAFRGDQAITNSAAAVVRIFF
jgi:hypothetical protein